MKMDRFTRLSNYDYIEYIMSIPERDKLIVRKNSGFGCCKCGLPIYEYHHIVKKSTDYNDIMLLCPLHHHKATVEAMTIKEQRKYQNNPYNIRKGFVEGQLKINHSVPVVKIGDTIFINDGDMIIVDNEGLVSLNVDEGRLELSLVCYDEDNNLLAKINKNEWIVGDPLPWDMKSKFQNLQIRRKKRDIQLDINVKKFPIELVADLWKNNQNIKCNSKGIFINGVIKNSSIRGGLMVGLRLEIDTEMKTTLLNIDPRFENGKIIVGKVTPKKIENGINFWKIKTCNHDYVQILQKKKYVIKKCSRCNEIQKIWI